MCHVLVLPFIFGILVGYYVFYYAGVLRRGRGLQQPPGDSTLHA